MNKKNHIKQSPNYIKRPINYLVYFYWFSRDKRKVQIKIRTSEKRFFFFFEKNLGFKIKKWLRSLIKYKEKKK